MNMSVGVAAAGLVVALLAGCGGDGDGGEGGEGATATTEAADEETSPTCDLLDTDRVSELFGTEATVQPPEPGASDVASSCIWQAEVGDADAPAVYQLQLTIYPGGAFYDPAMWGGTPDPGTADPSDQADDVVSLLRDVDAGLG